MQRRAKLVKIHHSSLPKTPEKTFTAKEINKARISASLHCSHYRKCVMKVQSAYAVLNCHICKDKDVIVNHYRREIGSESLNCNNDYFPVHLKPTYNLE